MSRMTGWSEDESENGNIETASGIRLPGTIKP
jgi:hypothetical protein